MISLAQILALAAPFIFGSFVGTLIKRSTVAALVLLVIFLLAVAVVYMSPSTVMNMIQSLGTVEVLNALKSMASFSSVAFVIGLIIGIRLMK